MLPLSKGQPLFVEKLEVAAAGVVDLSIFPHLGHELMSENTMAEAERWAADIAGPAYAIDDQTAISVIDGAVRIISEGQWKQLDP